MKVKLNNGRKAVLGCQLGQEKPVLERPLPVEAQGKAFRSVKLTVTVFNKKSEIGSIEGMSWCNPIDQFSRRQGRIYAMRRLFEINRELGKKKRLLSKKECRVIAAAIIGQNKFKSKAKVESEAKVES